jgi:hypothetical protein
MFRHASVGTTINDGLNCLQGSRTHPAECTSYPAYRYDRRKWVFQPRGNSGWYGKIDDFRAEFAAQRDSFDVFSFKYCYLDGLDGLQEPCGSTFNGTAVHRAWEALRSLLDSLEDGNPQKVFVWWTIPLTRTGQLCTDTLNNLIRQHCRANGKVLFDIADIEAHDTTGVYQENASGYEIAWAPYCGETGPGGACHPDWLGSRPLARAFWWMMAQVADAHGISAVARSPSETASSSSLRVSIADRGGLQVVAIEGAEPGHLAVQIFDILGRQVRSLFSGTARNARMTLSLPNADQPLPSGTYFVVARTSSAMGVVKLAVIR